MQPASHLLLYHRKILAARLVYLEAILPFENSILDEGKVELDSLDKELTNLINEMEGLEDDEVSLDTFLNGVFREFEKYTKKKLDRQRAQSLKEVIPIVRKKVASISCEKCSHLSKQVCDGGRYDDEIVGQKGLCIETLHNIFKIADKAARLYYKSYGEPLFIKHLPGTDLSTEFSINKPHMFPVDYNIGGTTKYCDITSKPHSRIIFHVCVKDFDSMTFMAFPYVMFHECIAHAFHGIYPQNQERKSSKPSDRFSEGWMDWVSYKIIEEILSSYGPAAELRGEIAFPNERLLRAQNFHQSRIDPRLYKESNGYRSSDPFHRKIAERLKSGALAAQKVFELMKKRPELCPDPWKSFLKLSFDLNMLSDVTAIDRDKFVTVMDFLDEHEDLKNEYLHPGYLDHIAVAKLVSDYLEHRNIYFLLDTIKKFKPRKTI